MKKIILSILALTTVGWLGLANAVDTKVFPKTFHEFEKFTFNQMKALPDLKWSKDKTVTEADLQDKSETELIILKNSIYAQHGFRFSEKTLANYFLSRPWYHADPESLNVQNLSSLERKNVETFLKAHATVENGGRSTASTGDPDVDQANEVMRQQIAYNLFSMGFCTYKVGSDDKAGLIVFDPNGNAQVFHSRASRSMFEAYAYTQYLNGMPGGGSLLIPAKWSINLEAGKPAMVLINFNDADIAKYTVGRRRLLEPGERVAISIDFNKNGDNPYPFVTSHQCQLTLRK